MDGDKKRGAMLAALRGLSRPPTLKKHGGGEEYDEPDHSKMTHVVQIVIAIPKKERKNATED